MLNTVSLLFFVLRQSSRFVRSLLYHVMAVPRWY